MLEFTPFIEVTDGTHNRSRAKLMPGRHSPPTVASIETSEKLKRPGKKGPEKEKVGPQPLHRQEIYPLGKATAPLKTARPPEPLNTPATPTPLSNQPDVPGTAPSPSARQTASNHTPSKNSLNQVNGIEFHHQSEAEFARLLTYYGIEWQYEPHQFPLQWRDGRPVVMFAPDFYLTEYDLYIELTTMRQSLVRRKNRKLRLIRALYPDINIKLIYRRDYQRLLQLFGIKPEEVEADAEPQEAQRAEQEREINETR